MSNSACCIYFSQLLRYAVVNEDLLSFKNTYWIDSDYMGYIENVKEINWKNADTGS